MILFGVCIRKDRDGIKFVIAIKRWEKVIFLKKYPELVYPKAPEMTYPSMLTEMPTGKVFDVEDMDKEPEKVKLIEPEDM